MQITSPNGTPASRLVFGTMQFGGRADATQSREMYEAARGAGITHFDTAYVYTDGASERLLGEFIGDARDDLVIATKVGSVGGGSRADMFAQFDVCRQRLDLDMVDILYLHRFDPDTDLRETMDAFATLLSRGQIRYIGLSNFAAWQVMKAQALAAAFDTRIAVFQPMYSLVKRQVEVEILPMCIDQGIMVAPYSPLGGGLLTGKYVGGGAGRLTEDQAYAARYAPTWMHDAAAGLVRIAECEDVDPATLAVAWTLAHASRPNTIISARNLEQLQPSLAAAEFQMTEALYTEISALSPTPAPATDRLEEQA